MVVHGAGAIHDYFQRARCRLALAFVSSTMSCCVDRLHVPLFFGDSVTLCLASVLWSQEAAAAARSLVVSPEWSSELAWAGDSLIAERLRSVYGACMGAVCTSGSSQG